MGADKRRSCVPLWTDRELTRYIESQAQRHFRDPADQADARQAAWEAIEISPRGLDYKQKCKVVYRAINRMYKKIWRRRKREVVLPDPEATAKNSSGGDHGACDSL